MGVTRSATDRTYENEHTLLVTQTDYRYFTGQLSSYQTSIHRFDLSGADATYVASGSISGYLQSQLSLDEADGVVRVATTDYPIYNVVPLATADAGAPVYVPPTYHSSIVTLGSEGQKLVELGRTPDFGDNEQIYATCFSGDRAYVSTYRQIDPLSVIDLSDPTAPRLLGELQLPGYSNFLFPLPDHKLFSIISMALPSEK